MKERFMIELEELPEHVRFGSEERWQADCGNDHARGKTPSEAISRLVDYTRARRRRLEV